jgi:TolB-like protein
MRNRLTLYFAACALCGGCATTASTPPAPPSPAQLATLEARARRDSASAALQLELAAAYLGLHRAADARVVAERALSRGGPTYPRAALLLGVAHEELGAFAEARASYGGALRSTGSPRLRSQLQQRLVMLQRHETQAYVKEAIASEARLATAPPRPHSVAVFPLGVQAPDSVSAALGYGLTAMLITDLSQTDRLTVVDRVVVQALLDEIRLGASGRVDERTAARGGRLLGAERIVRGSLVTTPDALTIDAAVVRPGTSREAQPARGSAITESDVLENLFDVEKRLALRIYAALGIELTPAERAHVTRLPTTDLRALIAYGRGLQASDAGDLAAALRFFSDATHIDPGFTLATEQAATAQAITAAAAVTTQQLTATAGQFATMASAAWSTTLPVSTMLRDAVAELLGTEGLSIQSAIDYFIRKPAGMQ